MKRILIAANCTEGSISQTVKYIHALRGAGAVAVAGYARDEADAEALAGAFDALLMPGGGDIPASWFGQEPHPQCNYDHPARDKSDSLIFSAFRKTGKRILGICRGCQVANVFLGGTLYQHLPDAFDPVLWHPGNSMGRHGAVIEPDTLLSNLLGAGPIRVNSSHHQAIDKLGEGVRVVARATDGVIEACEGENLLLLQWHPEWMGDDMRPVFAWLVADA